MITCGRDVNETLRSETETRPRPDHFSRDRDRDRDVQFGVRDETETETLIGRDIFRDLGISEVSNPNELSSRTVKSAEPCLCACGIKELVIVESSL